MIWSRTIGALAVAPEGFEIRELWLSAHLCISIVFCQSIRLACFQACLPRGSCDVYDCLNIQICQYLTLIFAQVLCPKVVVRIMLEKVTLSSALRLVFIVLFFYWTTHMHQNCILVWYNGNTQLPARHCQWNHEVASPACQRALLWRRRPTIYFRERCTNETTNKMAFQK